MPEIAYVNGKFMPLEDATVHVEDRGFQFADAVYEVVRTYGGKPFAVDEHLARLSRSLETIQLQCPLSTDQLKWLINDAIGRAGFAEAVVYLQITRGRAPRNRGFPKNAEPTVVLTVRALPQWSGLRETGVAVITVPDTRWARCDIKSVALLANVLAHQTARQAGAHDAVFVGPDGVVTEATAGNVFLVAAGKLSTPAKGPKILSGVTRDKIIETARSCGIGCEERTIRKGDLYVADEVFLTSTTSVALPIVSVDGKKVGTGRPGPVTARVYDQFVKRNAAG